MEIKIDKAEALTLGHASYIAFEHELSQSLYQIIDDIKTGKYDTLKLSKHRAKRSLDANAYLWVLVSKIADTLTKSGGAVSKDDVYLDMLKRYGQGAVVKIPKDKEELFLRGYKYCEVHEKLSDDSATYFKFWVGSSDYNSEEMSVLLNGVISECQDMGIDTMTPDEVANMVSLYNSER